jgi:hypothetical protein
VTYGPYDPRASREAWPASLIPGRPVPVLLEDHLAQHGPPPYAAIDELVRLVPPQHGAVADLASLARSSADSVVARCDLGGSGAAGPDVRIPALAARGLAVRDRTAGDFAAGDFAAPDRVGPDLSAPDLVAPDLIAPDLIGPDLIALWLAPHLVFDGLQLTATAVGAMDAYVDLGPAAHPRLHRSLRQAIAERDQAALDLVPAQLASPPPGTATVTLTPERLAQVALIARYGR